MAADPGPGPGVDARGRPVIDPTKNVLDLVQAAIRRQDDLRAAADHYGRDIAELRARHDAELRRAESARIDAIRATDVAAVNRAAEVATHQAATLAAEVGRSAEAFRIQVAATASAATVALTAALDPIKKDIADLRRAQHEAQGAKGNVGETRLNVGAILGALAVAISLVILIVNLTR